MSLSVFRAGVPQFELWAADPGLLGLPLTRDLFTIASRIMYVRRLVRLPEYLLIRRRENNGDFLPGSDTNVVCGKMITHVV